MRSLGLVLLTSCAVTHEPAAPVELPACASPYLAEVLRRTTDFVEHGTVSAERYLTTRNVADPMVRIDGPQIFPAMRELIARARHEIDLQTYVWEADTDPTNEILSGLIDLDRRRALEPSGQPPVVVRMLFDVSGLSFGSTITALPRAHASIAALQLDPAHVTVEIGGFHHAAFGNLHVKTLVVDGREAVITGANPQAHHDYAQPWRDAGFRLSGEVATALQDDFDDAWSKGQLWTCGSDESHPESCNTAPSPIVHAFDMDRVAQPETCLPMLVITRDANPAIGGDGIANPQDAAFLAMFASSKTVIRMQTPNLNDDAAVPGLFDAITRGVRVDLVLSKGFNDATEALPGQGGNNEDNVDALYDRLEQAGVTDVCSKLRTRWHARDGVAVEGNGIYASHAKYTSFDDAVVIVGTANMDTQSWNNSREVNVLVDDPTTTRAWDSQLFSRDFDNGVVVERCR